MERTMKERFVHRFTGALTVALAVFVLLACWVLCTQQKASAVTAGKYDIRFVVYEDGDGRTGEKTLKINYKYSTNNGQGTQSGEQQAISQGDLSFGGSSGESNGKTVDVGSVNGFPTWVWCKVEHENYLPGNGVWRIKIYAKPAGSGSYRTVGDFSVGTAVWAGSTEATIDSGFDMPYANSITRTSISGYATTGDIQLQEGSTATYKKGAKYTCYDQYGVRIGVAPEGHVMTGKVTSDGSNSNNYNGFEMDEINNSASDGSVCTGQVLPDCHLSGQNKNRQTVTFLVRYTFNEHPVDDTFTFVVTDEYYTTTFYDRDGNRMNGTASWNGPALTNSGRTTFNTATNTSGVQYTYYGDAVIPPFDYTGADDPSHRFVPMTPKSGEVMLSAEGTPKYGNTDELKAKVRKDAATYHYIWKGWTPLLNDNGANDAGVRNINSSTRYDGARTGPAAKYQTAAESLILQECFTKEKHVPNTSDHGKCPSYSSADCTTNEFYYKICDDTTCKYKFTIKGEGALGKGVDNIWERQDSHWHHKWDMAPTQGPFKEYHLTDDNVLETTEFTLPASAVTAFSETCTVDGSRGYFHCERCGKYFSYNKIEDETDENWLVEDDYVTPMDEDEITEAMKISAPGHDYQFNGWTWATGTNGNPDYNSITGTISCANTEIHQGLNQHTFTLSTTAAPTASAKTKVNKVNNQDFKIQVTTRDATCTSNGSETYLVPSDTLSVRITPPEVGAETIDVMTPQAKGTKVLQKLGHDYRGEWVGTGYNRRTDTYSGHQRKCVRFDQCKSYGINLSYDANDNVTNTNPGGITAHDENTVTSSSATCQVYAVCADCGNKFGSLAAHDFSVDPERIQNSDDESETDDPMPITAYAGHYYSCSFGCGAVGVMIGDSAEENSTEKHDFDTNEDGVVTPEDGVLLRPASCTVNGRRVYTCVKCGFKHYTKLDADLIATGHNYEGQEVTLTPFKTGDVYNTTMTASVTCKNANCGKYDEQGNQITQVRNVATETVDIVAETQAPTCTEDGLVTRTATFTDPAFSGTVLNGEPFALTQTNADEVLRATGHNWVNVKVEWNADHTACIGSAQCANDPEHNVTQSAIVSRESIVNPTCTNTGLAKFSASFEDEHGDTLYYDTFSIPNRSFQGIYNAANDGAGMDEEGDVPALGHDWAEFNFVWVGDYDDENGFTGVVASCRCSRVGCRLRSNETGTVTEVYTPATCEEDGSRVWTASFQNSYFTDELTRREDISRVKHLDALGHAYDYDNVTYSSTRISGGWRYTAKAICLNDRSHVKQEAVNCTFETYSPTCTENGRTIYTATFTDPHFETQTKIEETPALGHAYGAPVITWDQDPETLEYTAAHAVITCANDASHTIEQDCTDVERYEKKQATCEEKGLIIYTARFGKPIGAKNISRETDKLDHDLGEIHHGNPNTCAVAGFRDYRICSKCKKFFFEEPIGSGTWVETTQAGLVLYPSAEHNDENGDPYPVATEAYKAPTCKDVGNKKVTYCSGCKLIFTIDDQPIDSAKNYRFGKDTAQYELPINPTGHPSLEATAGEAATCEHTGIRENWYCIACDKYFSDAAGTVEIPASSITIPISGHDYDFESVEPAWSADHTICTVVAVCRNNAEHVLREEAAGVKNVIVPATCETDGSCTFSATFTNPGFGTKTTEEMVDAATGHDWDKTGEKYKPTYAWAEDYSACTATVYCKNDKTHSQNHIGTVASNTEIAQDCDVDGKLVYTATFADGVKSDTKSQTLPMTGHDWDYTGATYPVIYEWSPDRSHCTANVRCKNNPVHVKGVTVVATLITIRESTCTEDGVGVYEAEFGFGIPKDNSERVSLAKSGHRAQRVAATPATCLESGIYAHYYCSQCGRYFSDMECQHEMAAASVIQAKIPHDLVRHPAITPTCTQGGCREHWTCTYCGKYFLSSAGNAESETTKEFVTLEALKHNWVKRPGKEPTCTEAGWGEYDYCLRCKEVSNYTSIPAIGHSDYVYDYVHSSTSADGSVRWDVYKCGRDCGAFYTNMAVTLRDKNGKGVPNANVTITNSKTGKTIAGGSTDAYGEFAPPEKFTEGSYKITVSYEDANNTYYASSVATFYTDENHEVCVIQPKLGKTDFVPSTNDGSGSGSGSGGSQPSTPSNVCKWCGQVHTGFFGKLIQFFHNILILFGRR